MKANTSLDRDNWREHVASTESSGFRQVNISHERDSKIAFFNQEIPFFDEPIPKTVILQWQGHPKTLKWVKGTSLSVLYLHIIKQATR